MNILFGDATTAMPTPATQAERASILGVGSPASMDIRRGGRRPGGRYDPDDAIPGLDIDPPDLGADTHGKVVESSRGRSAETNEGIGGWIGRLISRARNGDVGSNNRGQYGRIQQRES